MKVINYICNRCGKPIEGQGIYAIVPELLNEDGETTRGLPDSVADELYALCEDKHLCLGCLKKVLKGFGAPAVPNPEFVKELPPLPALEEPKSTTRKPAQEESVQPDYNPPDTLTKEMLQDLIEKQRLSVKQVAEKLHLEISGVYKKIEKWGIQLPSKRNVKAPKLSVDEVKRLYLGEGKNIMEVAEALGVDSAELRQFMIKNRISKNAKDIEKYLKTREAGE